MSTQPPTEVPISEQLSALLKKSGLTQEELAKRLGTSQSAISRYFSPTYDGHKVKMLKRIGEALGVSLEMSFSGDLEVGPYRYDAQRVARRWLTKGDTSMLKVPESEEDYNALVALENDLFAHFSEVPPPPFEGLLLKLSDLQEGWMNQVPLLEKTSR